MGHWISPSKPQSQGLAPRLRASRKSQVAWVSRIAATSTHCHHCNSAGFDLVTSPHPLPVLQMDHHGYGQRSGRHALGHQIVNGLACYNHV